MKKQSLFLVFLIISLSCINLSAQASKGKILFGGTTYIGSPGLAETSSNIGYTTTKDKDDSSDDDEYKGKTFSYNLTPKVGYFVIDNLALGLDITLFSSTMKITNMEYKSNSTKLTAGPFVRYYIPTKKVLPFAEAMYSVGTYKNSLEWDGEDNNEKYQIQLYSVGIGVAVPLGEKVSFDALVGYQSAIYKDKEHDTNNQKVVTGTIA